MYPDLFKGLGLKNQDLIKYDTPLVSFDGRVMIPEGQISLPVNMEGKEVMVTFIVVSSFSPYTTILGRSWIHAVGAVPSTLHVKVKFHIEQGVAVVREVRKLLGNAWSLWSAGRTSRLNENKLQRRHRYSNYRSPKGKWGLVVLRS